MSFLAILHRAEKDCSDLSVELHPTMPPFHGVQVDNFTLVRNALQKAQKKIEFVQKISVLMHNSSLTSLNSEAVEALLESIEAFQQLWGFLFSSTVNQAYHFFGCPSSTYCNESLLELRSIAIALWVDFFSSLKEMESFFQSSISPSWAEKCVSALVSIVTLLLHEYIKEGERKDDVRPIVPTLNTENSLQNCVLIGCIAMSTIVQSTMQHRMALFTALRVLTPPLETMTFILKIEKILVPLEQEQKVLSDLVARYLSLPTPTSPPTKLLENTRKWILRYAFFYGEFVSQNVFSPCLLSQSPLETVPQNIPDEIHASVNPVCWSFWMWLCGLYQSTVTTYERNGEGNPSFDPVRLTAGQYLIAATIEQFFTCLHQWQVNIPAPLPRRIQTREILLLVFMVRLWREILGASIYHSMISRILCKLLATDVVKTIPSSHESTDTTEEGKLEDRKSMRKKNLKKRKDIKSNTNNFFAVIWAVPGLAPEEIQCITERHIVPWDLKFPKASFIRIILYGNPIYVTPHLCRRLKHVL